MLHGIGIVHDDDAAASFEGPVSGLIDGLAHLVDFDRSCFAGLDDEHVPVQATGDARARGTRAAAVEIPVLPREAIDELRERDGREPFADTVGAPEDQARRKRPARGGAGNELPADAGVRQYRGT